MVQLKPSTDVQPLSAFRANAAGFLEQVRETKRPLLLTQHGRSAAVLLDVEVYEDLMEEVELVRDIVRARMELDHGEGIPHEQVVAELKERFGE